MKILTAYGIAKLHVIIVHVVFSKTDWHAVMPLKGYGGGRVESYVRLYGLCGGGGGAM